MTLIEFMDIGSALSRQHPALPAVFSTAALTHTIHDQNALLQVLATVSGHGVCRPGKAHTAFPRFWHGTEDMISSRKQPLKRGRAFGKHHSRVLSRNFPFQARETMAFFARAFFTGT